MLAPRPPAPRARAALSRSSASSCSARDARDQAGGGRGARRRGARARARRRSSAARSTSSPSRQHVDALASGRGRRTPTSSICALNATPPGRAHRRRAASAIAPACSSSRRESSIRTHLVPAETGRSAAATPSYRIATDHLRRRERLRADRSGHRPRRRARRGELLHLVPRAGQGLVLEGPAREGRPPASAQRAFKKSPFGVTLAGCPLEEKISEFHKAEDARARRSARSRSSSSTTRWCAATGHRICNDCMKSCIYQKQEPVDIPQAETRTLKDVLELPWGFEIYSLLTRWNPLNLRRPLPRPRDRQARAGRRHGPGRLHARASPDERRPHRGRHRRAQDRAARRRELSGVGRARRARAVRADPRRRASCTSRSTTA